MKLPDISPLKGNEEGFFKNVSDIEEHYKCEWDDPVHDSYHRYVKDNQEYARMISRIRSHAEDIVYYIDKLGIDEFRQQAERLCREADEV